MKTINEVLKSADSIADAANEWHLIRGGSMSDTTNPVMFSDSLAEIVAAHKASMESQTVVGNSDSLFDALSGDLDEI